MTGRKPQDDATLLDVLIDGFEKNEVLRGFHWRDLPMPDEASAIRKFAGLADEARRWKGTPLRSEETSGRRLIAWSDLEIRQSGRGVMVRIKTPSFDNWWNEPATWEGSPMGEIFDWIEEEAAQNERRLR
jgi:hypothetical protein